MAGRSSGFSLPDKCLIDLVREHPILYKSASEYRLKGKQHLLIDAWNQIALKLGKDTTSATCKRRWKCIRDRYIKAKRRLRNGEINKNQCKYLDGSLDFLQSKSGNELMENDILILDEKNDNKKDETENQKDKTEHLTYVTQDMIENYLKQKTIEESELNNIKNLQEMSTFVCSSIDETINKHIGPKIQFQTVPMNEMIIPQTTTEPFAASSGLNKVQIKICDIETDIVDVTEENRDEDDKTIITPVETETDPLNLLDCNDHDTAKSFREMAIYVEKNFPIEKQRELSRQIWSMISNAQAKSRDEECFDYSVFES